MDEKLLSEILTPKINRWKMLNKVGMITEVRMEMVRYFSLYIDGPLEEVYKELQRAKSKGAHISHTESLIDQILLSKLRYELGDEVYHMMKECF